jgi:hypothetical protein
MYVLSIAVCPFVLFLLAIVLSVLLRYTVSDCPFGIFKLFLIYASQLECATLYLHHMPLGFDINSKRISIMVNTMAKRKSTKGQTAIDKTYI